MLLAAGGHAAQSGCVVLYDVKSGRRIAKIGDELDSVLAADINSTQTLVALGGPSRVVRIYSAQTGELQHEIRKHTDWIYAVEFSPDGKLRATADRSGGLFVWEGETAREVQNLRGHTNAVFDVAWRPDAATAARHELEIRPRVVEQSHPLPTLRVHLAPRVDRDAPRVEGRVEEPRVVERSRPRSGHEPVDDVREPVRRFGRPSRIRDLRGTVDRRVDLGELGSAREDRAPQEMCRLSIPNFVTRNRFQVASPGSPSGSGHECVPVFSSYCW